MAMLGEWARRIWYLLNRRRFERELELEMRAHRDAMSDPQRFGNVTHLREQSHDAWGWRWLDDCRQDIRQGARQLQRSPTFTAVALLTLGLAIGVNTALYGAVNAALFTRLPVDRPDELRSMEWSTATTPPGFNRRGHRELSYATFEYLRDRVTTLRDVFCLSTGRPVNVRIGGEIHRSSARIVSGNYFAALGVAMQRGRPITHADDRLDAAPVVVMSHSFRQRLFDVTSDPIGHTIEVNGQLFTIVGIAPASFYVDSSRRTPDLFVPWSHNAQPTSPPMCHVVGRRMAGTPEGTARLELERLVRDAHRASVMPVPGVAMPTDATAQRISVGLVTAGRGIDEWEWRDIGETWPAIVAVSAIAAAVILIACANIGGLLLARTSTRQSEIAARLAVGATRSRIMRQLLTESLLLGSLGGAIGVALCGAIVRTAATFGVVISVDATVLSATACLSIGTGLLFGLVPALNAARVDVFTRITPGSSGVAERSLGKALIGVQVAVSCVLLVTAGLQMQTLIDAAAWGPRDPSQLLLFRTNARASGYSDAATFSYHDSVLEQLSRVPGISSASVLMENIEVTTLGRIDTAAAGANTPVTVVAIAPRFFETAAIPLVAGRAIEAADRQGSPRVAVVNQAFAQLYLPGTAVIGKHLVVGTVVGVAASTRHGLGLKVESRHGVGPTVYVSLQHRTVPAHLQPFDAALFVLRTETAAAAVVPLVRRWLTQIDPNVPIDRVHTMAELMGDYVQLRRRLVIVFGVVATIALLQASLGIYGTLSVFVTRRTREIGIRIALGAARFAVIGLVIRQSVTAVLLGVVFAVAAVPAVTKLLVAAGIVSPAGVLSQFTIAAVVTLAALAAGLAASAPAWHATRVDPARALRFE